MEEVGMFGIYRDIEDDKYIVITRRHRTSKGRRLIEYSGWIRGDGGFVRHGLYGQSLLRRYYRKVSPLEAASAIPDLLSHAVTHL